MMRVTLFWLLACLALGVGGCDDEDVIKAAAAKGIFLQKKQVEDPPGSGKMAEKYVVVKDPSQDAVGGALQTAKDATSGLPILPQALAIITLLTSLGGNWLQKRMQLIADKKNAELAEANDRHDATHTATSLGLQNFVNSQPLEIGKALIDHLDSVHDHMDVPAEHQDLLQPTLKAA